MRSEGLDLEQALRDIRRVSPNADPNEGFREQLELYLRMGCRIDVNNPLYRHHLLKQQGKKAVRGIGQPKTEAGAEAEAEIASDLGPSERERRRRQNPPRSTHHVRNVRASGRVLPGHPCDPPHGPRQGPERVAGLRRAQPRVSAALCTWSPSSGWRRWREGRAAQLLQCKARVGHFSWSGMQCSCTQWVTPAFSSKRQSRLGDDVREK